MYPSIAISCHPHAPSDGLSQGRIQKVWLGGEWRRLG